MTGRSGDGGIDGAGVLRVNLISFLDASADELLADLDAAEAAEAGDAV